MAIFGENMEFNRQIAPRILAKFGKGKAILLTGPRQVGKTTLIKHLLAGKSHLFLDGDDPTVRELLTDPNTEALRALIGNNTVVFLDEAQRISNIGLTLKIIVDQIKTTQLIVSGSSSFDLGNLLQEPLTGRKWEFELFPISWAEYEGARGYLKVEQQLENRLLYGFYPDVLNNQGEEKEVLKSLLSSYLFKDIFAFAGIRKPELLEKLVAALAWQIGNEVSYNELSQLVGVDKNTISNYIDLLEKGFVVFRLGSFSRNLRNEIKFNRKIYFYDTGIRNMVINNFSPLELRPDKGALWENFLIAERLKHNSYTPNYGKMYFWRNSNRQEIDLVEVEGGTIRAFEFKWKKKKILRIPNSFAEAYSPSVKFLDRSNFREILG